jgi:hypothetical protein
MWKAKWYTVGRAAVANQLEWQPAPATSEHTEDSSRGTPAGSRALFNSSASPWRRQMRLVIEVVVGWIVLSCTVGPVLTWMFFWGARRSIAIETAGQRSAPTYKSPSSKWRFTPAAVVLVLAIIGSLGVVLLRNGAAADADIVDMRRP